MENEGIYEYFEDLIIFQKSYSFREVLADYYSTEICLNELFE